MAAISGKQRPASRKKSKTSLRVTRDLKARAIEVLDRLDGHYPQATTELDFTNNFELLVAVILSAQCTDKRINMVTPGLFGAYPNASSMAQAEPEDIESWIRTCGLYRNKAKNLVACARQLVAEHKGSVPGERKALEALAGVGRKTANVVLSNAFGVDAIAVDTHVHRLSHRLGFSKANSPNGVEVDLMAILPQNRWTKSHHTLIWHGRRCCDARKPACPRCPVADLCPGEQTYPEDIAAALLEDS